METVERQLAYPDADRIASPRRLWYNPTAALNVVDPEEAAIRLLEGRGSNRFQAAFEAETDRRRALPDRIYFDGRSPVIRIWLDHGDTEPIRVPGFRQAAGFLWWTKHDGTEVGVPDHRIHKIEIEKPSATEPREAS